MEKTAKKRAFQPICVVLAVLFCFGASVLFFLYTLQIRFGGDFDDPRQREQIFMPLLDIYCEELTDAFQVYYRSGGREFADCPEKLLPQNTNLRLIARDAKTEQLLLRTIPEMPDDADALLHETLTLPVTYTADGDFLSEREATVRAEVYLPRQLQTQDGFYWARIMMRAGEAMQLYFWAGGVVLAACALLCMFLSLRGAYREGGLSRGAHRLFREIPPDLWIIYCLPFLLFCVGELRGQNAGEWLLQSLYTQGSFSWALRVPFVCAGLCAVLLTEIALLLFSCRRYGARGMLTFLRYEKAAFTRKTLPVLLLLQGVKVFLLAAYGQGHPHTIVWCLLLEKAVTLPVLYRCLREMRTVAENTEAIAAGELSRPIGSAHMYRSLKNHADDIRSIAQRISVSADEYIRSGQFKTELITNLSHDIKTPLTSIINYAALLQDETLSPQDKARYIAVLHRHAERLSRLVEDLTQVSDTQSGKIEAHPVRLDLADLVIRSAMGFEERLQKQNITIRFSVPQTPVPVWADTRLLWRVADNLMNNICKYSAAGTTVQISVTSADGKGTATYQNVPALPPGKSADALMERFVRADNSRHTEGSGLGLSIARSLMQLQGGTLTLQAKPELFSAQITLDGKES